MEKKKKRKPIDRKELRFINDTEEDSVLSVEYRDAGTDGDKTPVIHGKAIVFNSESRDLGGFKEIISPNAFDRFFEDTGEAADIAALWSHDVSQVLGRTPTTLKLIRKRDGIYFELTPPNSRQDIIELVERRDVRGASFAFTVAKGGEEWSEANGATIRTINQVDEFFEISLVLQPAYTATSVGAARRSLAGWRRRKENRDAKVALLKNKFAESVAKYNEYLKNRD